MSDHYSPKVCRRQVPNELLRITSPQQGRRPQRRFQGREIIPPNRTRQARSPRLEAESVDVEGDRQQPYLRHRADCRGAAESNIARLQMEGTPQGRGGSLSLGRSVGDAVFPELAKRLPVGVERSRAELCLSVRADRATENGQSN
jgi:hypothetical protein